LKNSGLSCLFWSWWCLSR